MDTDDLRELADSSRFISRIYHYCDHWCERCPLSARCLVYAMEQKDSLDPVSRAIGNAVYRNHLQKVFQQTQQMLQEMAKESGVTMAVVYAEIEAEARRRQAARARAKHHELARRARAYARRADNWFHNHRRLIKRKKKDLIKVVQLGLAGDPLGELASLQDAVAVIRWYQLQIDVKIRRALSGDLDDLVEEDPVQSDASGSAKVALISIDRSIAAWGRLREHLPDQADRLLDLLVFLDQFRRQVEQTFPHARAFVRPGFDTGEQRE